MSTPMVLVAYQCGPGLGSVSQIGWEWFHRLAQRHPVTLVTHIRNRTAIASAGALPPQTQVHYIDTEWLARPLYGLARRLFPRSEHSVFLVSQLDFFAFDRLALRLLRRLRRQAGSDWKLVHLVTPVSLSATTCLHRLGLPLIRGPLNCGLGNPPGFSQICQQESGWLWRLRSLTRQLDRLMGSSAGAAALLVASRATLAAVPRAQQARCIRMLENAVDPSLFPAAEPLPLPSPQVPLRICFVGRMVPVKAVDLLLHAVQQLRLQGHAVALQLGGDGPLRTEWQALSTQLGLDDCVQFTGALTAPQVAQAMADCHVFCLPSVRESGGAVLLEAMARARPVIAMDFGGPAEIVDNEVGRLVPCHGAGQAIHGLTEALLDCIHHPQAWRQRGWAAHQRVCERHTWPSKIAQAEQLYHRLLLAQAT